MASISKQQEENDNLLSYIVEEIYNNKIISTGLLKECIMEWYKTNKEIHDKIHSRDERFARRILAASNPTITYG